MNRQQIRETERQILMKVFLPRDLHHWEQWSDHHALVCFKDAKRAGVMYRDQNNPHLWKWRGMVFSALGYAAALEKLRAATVLIETPLLD